MTNPNPIHPGCSYSCARRVLNGAFRLTPRPDVVQIVKYLAIHYAKKHDVPLLILIVMSNHFQKVVDDPLGNHPEFLRDFHSTVAKTCNRLHFGTEKGQFWDHEKPSLQRLLTPSTTLDKLLYAALNPVAAGLEPRALAWPGYVFGPEMAGLVIRVRRPEILSDRFPEEHEYQVPVPQDYGDRDPRQVRAHFRRELGKREKLERGKRGDRPFAGTKAALKRTHTEVPWYPTPDHNGARFKPHFAGPIQLIAKAADARADFRRKHADCLRRQQAGEVNIEWPAGTYAQVFRFGAKRVPSSDRSFSQRHHRTPPPVP